jgi:hypothetical protein
MEPEELKQILADYVATAKLPKYKGDFNVINSKFPELKDYDKQLLADYVATASVPEYKGDFEIINSKFPEFFEVKKKDLTQPSAELSAPTGVEAQVSQEGYSVSPEYYEELKKTDTIFGGPLEEVAVTDKVAPKVDLTFAESIGNSANNFANTMKSIIPQLGFLGDKLVDKTIGRELYDKLGLGWSVNIGGDKGLISFEYEDFNTHRNRLLQEMDYLQKQIKPTTGFIESVKEGDLPGVISSTVGTAIDIAGTVIPAMLTEGGTLITQTAANTVYEYNQAKAAQKGVTVKELYEKGEDDIVAPGVLSTVSIALEKLGMKGLTNVINRKLAAGGLRNAFLFANDVNKEGWTEVAQLGVDTFNKAIASGKSYGEALEIASDTMFSEQGLEVYAKGIVGSSTLAVAGRGGKGIYNKVIGNKLDQVKTRKQELYSDIANDNIPAEAKKSMADEIFKLNTEEGDLVNQSWRESKDLPKEKKDRLTELEGNINGIDASLQDETISPKTKKTLQKKRQEFQTEFDGIIAEGQAAQAKPTLTLSEELDNLEKQNAVQEPSPEGQVPPVGETGETIIEGSEGVRPSIEGQEAPQAISKEEQVADIEKRRQEELNKISVDNRIKPGTGTGVKVGQKVNDGNRVIVINSTADDSYNPEINGDGYAVYSKIVSDAEFKDGKMSKAAEVEVEIFADKETADRVLEERYKKLKTKELSGGGKKIQAINAKYDAELAALESQAPQEVITEEEVVEPTQVIEEPADPERALVFDKINKSAERIRKKMGQEADVKDVNQNIKAKAMKQLEKSDWYNNADDIQREEAVREISKMVGEKQPRAPKVEKLLGIEPSKDILVNEASDLKKQIQMEAKAADDAFKLGKKTVQDKVNEEASIVKRGREALSTLIKNAKVPVFSGASVKGSVAYRMLKRVNDAKTPLQLSRALDYVEKSIADVNYGNKLNQAEKVTKAVLGRSGNLPVNLQDAIVQLSKSMPKRSADLDAYNTAMAAVQGSISKKGLTPIVEEDIRALTDNIKRNNLQDKVAQIQILYPDLADMAIDSINDMNNVVSAYNEVTAEASQEAPTADKAREAAKAVNDVLRGDLEDVDTEGMDSRDVELYEALKNIDTDKLNTKQLVFLNNAINNFVENGRFDGVGQYILNQYRIQQTYTPEFTKKLQNAVYQLNAFGKYLSKFRTLPTKLKSVFKTSEDVAYIRIGVGLDKHDSVYGSEKGFMGKIDKVREQVSNLAEKLGIAGSSESVVKIGSFSDMVQYKKGLTPEEIQQEFLSRKNAFYESIINGKNLMERSKDYASKYGDKIKTMEGVYEKYVKDSETPQDLLSKLTPKEAEFRNNIINRFAKLRPELERLSLIYKNKAFDVYENYFPRTYIYSFTETPGEELGTVSTRILDMSTGFGKQNVDTETSTAFDDRLIQNGKLPKDAIVNYDFLQVFQNEYQKQLYDATTIDSRSLMAQSLSSKEFDEALGKDLDTKQVIENAIDFRVKNEKNGLYPAQKKGVLASIGNAIRTMGNQTALGGIISPWAKQVIPALASTSINTADIVSKGVDGNDLSVMQGAIVNIQESPDAFAEFISSSPVSRRHKEQAQFISEGIQNSDQFVQMKRGLAKKISWWNDAAEKVFMTSLKKGDMTGAGISYLSYYKYNLLKRGVIKSESDFNMEYHAKNPDKIAREYAEQMSSQTLNINSRVDRPQRQILGGILPFISFSVNSMNNVSINVNRAISYGNGVSFNERMRAARELGARVAESVAINSTSGALRIAFLKVGTFGLSELVRASVADDDEEREILQQIADNTDLYTKKTWENVKGYIIADLLTGQIGENIIQPAIDTGYDFTQRIDAALSNEKYVPQPTVKRPYEALKIFGAYGIPVAKALEMGDNLASYLNSQNGYFIPQKFGYVNIKDEVAIPEYKKNAQAPEWAQQAYLFAAISNMMSLAGGGAFSEVSALTRRLPKIVNRTIIEQYGNDLGLDNKIKPDPEALYKYSKIQDEHATIKFNNVEYYLNPKQLELWNNYRQKWFAEKYPEMLEEAKFAVKQVTPATKYGKELNPIDVTNLSLLKQANQEANDYIINLAKLDEYTLKLDIKKDVKEKFNKEK